MCVRARVCWARNVAWRNAGGVWRSNRVRTLDFLAEAVRKLGAPDLRSMNQKSVLEDVTMNSCFFI
jgi:hypothetical protein